MQMLKNNYKLVLIFGLCLMVILSVASMFILSQTKISKNGSVSAETGTPDANSTLFYTYSSATTSYTVSDCALTATTIAIPSTFNDGTNGTHSVTSIGDNAFYGCTSLVTITIPDSVTSIGTRIFYDCHNLSSITVDTNNFNFCVLNGALLNKSQTTLIAYANMYAKSYTLPDTVTQIADYAFYNCTNLTSITINATSQLTTIGYMAFYQCTNMVGLTIPQFVTTIKGAAFSSLFQLTSISIPDSVTSIGGDAFYQCINLTTVTINATSQLTSIGTGVFQSCRALSTIFIPQYVTSIGAYPFAGCSNLSSIVVDVNNLSFISLDSALLDISQTTLLAYANLFSTSYELPDTVISIQSYAFSYCMNLETVTINSSSQLTTIGYMTFYYCNHLTSINIPDSVTSIDESAFCQCTNLATVNINATSQLESIGKGAFQSCSALSTIFIPQYVTSIGEYPFAGCLHLSSILVDVNNLSYISLDGALLNISQTTLLAYANLYSTSYVLPDTVTSIQSFAFENCTNLSTVTINSTSQLTSVGIYTFRKCTNLTSIFIPSGVTIINNYAFSYCTQLTKIYIFATTPPTLSSTTAFTGSGITSTSGYIYVLDSSLTAYKTASNWVTYADRIYDLSVNVSFDANGGTGAMADQAFHYEEEQNINTNSFICTGHRFLGWSGSAEGEVEYTDGQAYTYTQMTFEDFTLYAVWEALTEYTINFDANTGTGTMSALNFYEDETATLTVNTFTKLGFVFDGWATSAGGTVVFTDSGSIDDTIFPESETSITLYAVWSINDNTPYAVIYYQQNIEDDNYTEFESNDLTGTAFETVNASIKTYTGFTHITHANTVESGEIAGDGSLVLSVYYDRLTFTVTFINNSATYDTQTIKYMGSATTSVDPTRIATAQYTYTFTGWDTGYTNVTTNLIVTAQYSANLNYYDIVFQNSDESVLKTQTVGYGYDATPPNNPTREGYTFAGWSGTYTAITGKSTVIATYEANTYVIIFDGNEATSGSMSNLNLTYDVDAILSSNAFTKTGYHFVSWTWNSQTFADEESVLNLTNVNNDSLTFVAVWEINTYTIQYDANGGTGEILSQIFTYDIEKNLTQNTITRTGYTFLGWNTLANGEGTSFEDEQSILNLCDTNGSTVNLYAQWDINTYSLTFDSNGGSEITDILIAYGSEITYLPTPTKEAYTFVGWYLNGEKIELGDNFIFTDDVTLIAEWQLSTSTLMTIYGIIAFIAILIIVIIISIHFGKRKVKINNLNVNSTSNKNYEQITPKTLQTTKNKPKKNLSNTKHNKDKV